MVAPPLFSLIIRNLFNSLFYFWRVCGGSIHCLPHDSTSSTSTSFSFIWAPVQHPTSFRARFLCCPASALHAPMPMCDYHYSRHNTPRSMIHCPLGLLLHSPLLYLLYIAFQDDVTPPLAQSRCGPNPSASSCGKTSGYPVDGTCILYTDGLCHTGLFLSTCRGNAPYLLTPAGPDTFVVCSSIAQCERRKYADLSLTSTPSTAGPRGWFCGNPEVLVSGGSATRKRKDAALAGCPVWRYATTPAPAPADSEEDGHLYVDSAAAVVPEGSGTFYLMSAREEDRGYARALQAKEILSTDNRVEDLSIRSLADFSVVKAAASTDPSGAGAFLNQPTNDHISGFEIYKTGKFNRYFAAFARSQSVYFMFEECVHATSTGSSCQETQAVVSRACQYGTHDTTPTSGFNGYADKPL